MSFEWPDELQINGQTYRTSSFPLKMLFNSIEIVQPFLPVWPVLHRGYRATWQIKNNQLHLSNIQGTLNNGETDIFRIVDMILALDMGTIFAGWYTGEISASQGNKRYLLNPPRRISDIEITLQIHQGIVVNLSTINNTSIPDPTDDELRDYLPYFLWPDRLK